MSLIYRIICKWFDFRDKSKITYLPQLYSFCYSLSIEKCFIISPQTKWGFILESPCPSVGMSITKSYPGHNFHSIEASNFKLQTKIKSLRRRALYKNYNSIPFLFRVIALLKFFTMDFCPGHNFQSIEASNFKLRYVIKGWDWIGQEDTIIGLGADGTVFFLRMNRTSMFSLLTED